MVWNNYILVVYYYHVQAAYTHHIQVVYYDNVLMDYNYLVMMENSFHKWEAYGCHDELVCHSNLKRVCYVQV